jgi:hypothetical protein
MSGDPSHICITVSNTSLDREGLQPSLSFVCAQVILLLSFSWRIPQFVAFWRPYYQPDIISYLVLECRERLETGFCLDTGDVTVFGSFL